MFAPAFDFYVNDGKDVLAPALPGKPFSGTPPFAGPLSNEDDFGPFTATEALVVRRVAEHLAKPCPGVTITINDPTAPASTTGVTVTVNRVIVIG